MHSWYSGVWLDRRDAGVVCHGGVQQEGARRRLIPPRLVPGLHGEY